MFFEKKKKLHKCEGCGSRSEEKFSFCPHCGNNFIDLEKQKQEYGLLGKSDSNAPMQVENGGILDKMMSTMLNSLMRDLDKQFKEQMKSPNAFPNAEIKQFPNGIRIKISGPMNERPKQKKQNSVLTTHPVEEQHIKKMSELPREKAKANVKRLGNKIIYELTTPGVVAAQDVFISKLESGYEIKAIGNKKVYVNSIPINLPLHRYTITKNKLVVEFFAPNEQQDSFG